MSDRELLELAAKAAGIDYPSGIDAHFAKEWNPLTDDGDALRLAVKLGMDLSIRHDSCIADEEIEHDRSSRPDPYAATRRAIVRAAAEIGRRMR